MSPLVLFGMPLAAPVARMILMVYFCLTPSDVLSAAEQDRPGNRAIILPMAGFSLSALLALVVLDANRVEGLRVPIGLLLVSFLAFYTSLNLQSYKARRWQDQLGTGLKEAATGWLLFSVVAVVNAAEPGTTFNTMIAAPAFIVWGGDLLIRLTIDFKYLRDHEKN